MDRRRKNLWKSYIAAGLFGVSMPAIAGLTERESGVGLTEWESCCKWVAVSVFLASCPFVLRIDKWMPKDPPDAP